MRAELKLTAPDMDCMANAPRIVAAPNCVSAEQGEGETPGAAPPLCRASGRGKPSS